MTSPASDSAGQEFKTLLERCLRQARLNPRKLHLELRRERVVHVADTTIDSWLRRHSMTGRPSLPRDEDLVMVVARWLCARDGVTATDAELVEAWRRDTSYWAAQRAKPPRSATPGERGTIGAVEPAAVAQRGVVTFLSARITDAPHVSRRDAESAAQRLLGQTVAKHCGATVGIQGDEFLAAFAEAGDAVSAALSGQQTIEGHQWPEGVRIRVSMAVHSGRVTHTSTGYAGLALHQVGRMSAAAHGGQVVVSEPTKGLLGSALPDGATLADLGKPRLSDLSTPHRLFALCHRDLQTGLPPLKSLDAYPNNLPLQLSTFIGRDEQLEELRRSLVSNRLCTLTGSGGVGKTRLALHFAAELVEHFDDGVWMVDLASTPEPELVAQVVAGVLGVREGGTGTYAAKAKRQQRPLASRLADHLRPRHVLLLLDNCEHVVDACAALVERLLQTCPELKVLATSREPLGVAGELLHRVPTLAVPPVGATLSTEEIGSYESVQLFLDRAVQRRPDLRLAEPDIRAIVEICQRVDGSALAIELAAARVKMLSPDQILHLLEDRFSLLTSGSRTAAARHQTLRAMIDWSHDELSSGQQMLLRRLSVFVGGFELAAAQHVCAGEGLERFEILDLLGMLVDKSLVETDQHAGVMRYRLLETIRTYASEKLAACGEETLFRARHQQWYLDRAEEAEPALTEGEQLRWLDLLELDHDNLRAALDFGREPDDAHRRLRLAAALGHFWLVRGFITEGRDHLERALTSAGPVRPALRAKALAVAGYLAMFDSDVEAATEHATAALELSAELGYRRGEAWALRTLGWVAASHGRYPEALTLQQEGLDRKSVV
jgi:predicted ATPase/class 3 adenylate cyclase